MEERHEIGTSGVDQTSRVSGGPADDPSVELINERYSILSRIAEGPTGTLYRSRDVKTESEVTVKLLTGWPGLDASLMRQVREELSVTQALTGRRSNIALVHDCDLTVDGRVVVVMEPIRGRTLLELIQRREPLPTERALHFAFQIAEGLHAAHDLGLVHGALTAEHVLVEGVDTIKVVGFEVARLQAAARGSPHLDSGARSGGGANGPLPSERMGVLTEAADTQAVGTVLLEMLNSGVRPGSRSVGTLPVAVKQLVMQALVRVPGAPSHDMAALAKDLSAELGRRPQPSASRAWRRARPRPRGDAASLIGVGALAVGVSALVAWLTWSLVGTPRRPVTSEILAIPVQEVVSHPPSSGPGAAMPAQSTDGAVGPPRPPSVTHAGPLTPERPVATTAPSPGDAVVPGTPRVRPPRSRQPAIDTPLPAGVERAPTRPPQVAGPAPDSSSGRPEHDDPDPAGIIDWLIKDKGGLFERR
jgi:serine/threonine protein kinase